ncbi:MAG: MEDS domain-containing protein [Candidatus Bathyarchaeota archaeon]|nr:MEDS domain-containing protein [Candidatus Bathyarchaeota archaeon]MDH5787941.1 MEDS domain-containing protein [Candidatus Bathyarchaeota archaeon]
MTAKLPDDKDLEMLLSYGLTRNQAKVYLAVVRLGYASVAQVSKESKVRREDVYRSLPKLEKMGLVERLLGMPLKIRATPVEEAFSILIKREQDIATKRLEALKANKKNFIERFKINRFKPKFGEESEEFALISQRDGIISRLLSMIKGARKEIDIICSKNKLIQFLHTFPEPLRKALKRGVSFRIVTEMPEYEQITPRILEEYLSPGKALDLKYTSLSSSHFIMVDFNQALVATNTDGSLAENPCLWTNSKSLLSVFQGNFEDFWHNSFSWKTLDLNQISKKVVDFVGNLKPSNHVIFAYDCLEAKHSVLFNYIKVGLENGEMAVYVASENSIEEARKAMERFGINVEKYEKKGALRVLSYEDVYIIDGRFDINLTMSIWDKLYKESLSKGFKGLRVTGEMSCFFKHGFERELIEYERSLHRVLEIPMIAICAYDTNVLGQNKDPINLYSELVKAHGTVLFAGIDKKLGKIEIRKV